MPEEVKTTIAQASAMLEPPSLEAVIMHAHLHRKLLGYMQLSAQLTNRRAEQQRLAARIEQLRQLALQNGLLASLPPNG
eukprot:EC835865.1.p4 GENE.EC835865.1~~EC835865.1.p4  ORF type:complete len:79 (+),score=35.78 EC835865.1:262-498(+)